MPRLTKPALAVPALIVLIAAAAGGYQVYAQHQARAELDATLANLPAGSSGHYKTMSFNVFTHTLRIGGLSITRDGHPSFAVQDVTLHHLAGSGTIADPIKASALRLVNVTVWRGDHNATAKLIDGTDIQVLAPDVPPPSGTPSWLAAPGNGTLLAAGALTVTGIADDEGATLSSVSIANYENGHLRQAGAAGFADRHGNRIASAEAHDVDLDGLDAVFDTGRYAADRPSWPAPRPLIGHAEISGLQSENKGEVISLAAATLNGLAGRPFAAAPTPAYTKSDAFLRDAATDISLATASISGLNYRNAQTKLSASLKALSVSGYADGALAQASLDDLTAAGNPPAQLSVGHLVLNGLNATKLLHEASAGMSLVEAASHGSVHLASLALGKVSVTSVSGHPITLDSISQTTSGSAPAHFTFSLRGLSIPAQSNPELAQGLGALGIDPLVLDLEETGTYDMGTGDAALAPMVLTARGLGRLSLSAQFTKVPRDLLQDRPALAAFSTMGIGPFVFRFTNEGLVQRVIAMIAKQTGKTAAEVTDQAKLAAAFGAAGLVPTQPDAGAEVAAFIADPRVLTITATPASPIPLGAFLGAGRAAAQSDLNLRLTAN